MPERRRTQGARPSGAAETVTINRAPVLALCAAVVAERLGYDHDEALTLGKAVSGLNAYLKARALGIVEDAPRRPSEKKTRHAGEAGRIEMLGRRVPVAHGSAGVRAVEKDREITPESVERYLETKFGESLAAVRSAMEDLARSLPKDELAARGFALYESFRPDIPKGTRGWGAQGVLDLSMIREMARAHRAAN